MNIKQGFLADYFEKSFGYKRIKPVEIDPSVSNEHEFNGINAFKELLGEEKKFLKTRVLYLSDDEDKISEDNVDLTWYDARENHPARSEYRLYYTESICFEKAEPQDLMVLCRNFDGSMTMFIAREGDTVENQLMWLFRINPDDLSTKGEVKKIRRDYRLNYYANLILEKFGIIYEQHDDTSTLDVILKKFPNGFPKTSEFSSFARSLSKDIDPLLDVDKALSVWLEHEEYLFKTFEKYLVGNKLQNGFRGVDEFVSFSLSVQNRRKSRAGYALENHLRHIFKCLDIRYSYNKVTENKAKPDFIFPGIIEYHDDNFPADSLTMLGVKTTCKERWRQVLAEAKRLDQKHLFTLEPRISRFQTDEMISHNLQLVVPKEIITTYSQRQQDWLLTLADFTETVRAKQA